MLRRISERARELLLGISAYQQTLSPMAAEMPDIDSPLVERMRRMWGGGLQSPSPSQTRWYLADLESAERAADNGDLDSAGKLMQQARKDGIFAGVLSTRTGGLVRLPKRFRGDADVVKALDMQPDAVRSVFDEMFPPSEIALLAADGLLIGVGFGELLPVAGRAHPVFCRYEPRFLRYVWSENQWYMMSVAGRVPITPGDGRWVLHIPGGRVSPWSTGLWRAIGRAYIRKEHAALHKDNWEGKLANPARVAQAPSGAAEEQKESFFKQVIAWGVNTVFSVPVGWEVKLLESNGRGWESFNTTISQQENEMIIAVAGQTVTVDGGVGFANSSIHQTIRADLIKETADSLAYTINTQGIPVYVALEWGEDAILEKPCVVEWDVTPPKDRNQEAVSMVTAANATTALRDALAPNGIELNVPALCDRFGIPVKGDVNLDGSLDVAIDADKPAAGISGGAAAPKLRLAVDNTKPAAAPAPTDDGATPAAPPNASPAADGADPAAEKKADSALNGAQVTSLLEVIGLVVAGQLPRETAVEIIKVAFNIDAATADKLLGAVGNGFVPKSAEPAAPAAAPAAAQPVVEDTAAA
jgi:hypothetical protein